MLLELDTTLLAMLKLDTTLAATLKLDTTLLTMLKLDTTLLAMLKWATLPNVPLLAEGQHREGGIQAGEGGSPRRGALGKHLWAALVSAMLLEVDTVLDSPLLANLPDRWKDHSHDDVFPTRGSGGEWAGRCWVGRTSPPRQEVVSIFLSNKCSTQLALRLGGHEAAAFALYWLEEASNSGLHFDQAGVDYLVIFLMSSSSQS